MRRWTRRLPIVAAGMLACLLYTDAVQAKGPPKQAAYTIIPFLPPEIESIASGVSDLNNQGHAVGWAEMADGTTQALHLDLVTGLYTSLLGDGRLGAGGVNNINQIVGGNDIDGLFWSSPSAEPIVLPPLPGDVRSWATAINDAGIILGGSDDDFIYPATGVVWRVILSDQGGWQVDGPLPLGPLPGDTVTWGADINELLEGAAQVTGRSAGITDEAVVWTIALNMNGTLALPGDPVPLGTLGLNIPSRSIAAGINELGAVCGKSDSRPFVAFPGDAPQPLSIPRDTYDGAALAINDVGELVGKLDIRKVKGGQMPPPQWHAYLWRNGKAIDLQSQIDASSGWDGLFWADTINNAGVIGGWGRFDVDHRGFLLISVK